MVNESNLNKTTVIKEAEVASNTDPEVRALVDEALTIARIKQLFLESKKLRDEFAADWKKIENQVNLIPPEEWDDKQDWQTKIFLPLQAKADEVAAAMMGEMVFGGKRWFGITGVDVDDKQKETHLARFLEVLFEKGNFDLHNGYVTQECTRIGTSFMKFLVDQSKEQIGIKFSQRKCKDSLFDQKAVIDWDQARFWMEQYNRDIWDILEDNTYTQEKKDELLVYLGQQSQGKTGDLIEIENIEGTAHHKLHPSYQEVPILEFWGEVPVRMERKIGDQVHYFTKKVNKSIELAADTVLIKDAKNDYGFIPIQMGRLKRKQYYAYGNGLIKNGMTIQELANSIVNLGFDSAKISYLPMVVFETSAIADASSLDIKPLGKIELHDGRMQSFQLSRFNVNAMGEVIPNLGLLDQFHQEATGMTREAQGAGAVYDKDETLGQTQIKMASVERRMLKVAREFTEDYVIPLLRKVYKIITHKKWIDQFQELANRVLGVEKIEETVDDPITGEKMVINSEIKPKLILSELGKMDIDFKPLGLVNFMEKSDLLRQMDLLLQRIQQNPKLEMYLKLEEVLKRTLSMADIPDFQDLLKSQDEIEGAQEAMLQLMQDQGQISAPEQDQMGGMGGQIA